MERREFLNLSTAAIGALVSGPLLSSCKNNTSRSTHDKPNIVFIFIDDLGWKDTGYMGSDYYETPNIDKIAQQGMIFTNAYANAANCAPTRASLLTGQYSPRHGVFTVASSARGESRNRRLIPIENSREVELDKITIAEALKNTGYVSAAIGKWNVGQKPEQQGFDFDIDRDKLNIKGHFSENGEYLTDLLTDEAISFIKKNNPHTTKKPFFLYLCHHAVHTPISAKKNMIEAFEKKPANDCHNHAAYAAMIKSVDESVARINQVLEELELNNNTLLIFFSDNGGHGTYTCQKPLRGGKGMYYEGGIRVPMFVYWPVSVIRKRDWKLLMFHEEWVLDGGRKDLDVNNSIELYNLKDDIAEQNNLAQINTRKRDELLKELMDWQKNIKAPVPTNPNLEYKNI